MKAITAVLTAAALAGGVTAVLAVPSATASKDPCTASEVARTVGTVVKSAGDYLDAHPEVNQAMTSVLQQPPGPQSVGTLNAYFGANPKVQTDLQGIAEPLTSVSLTCKLPVSLPQVLGLMQAAQGQAGLPGGLGARPSPGTSPAPVQSPTVMVR